MSIHYISLLLVFFLSSPIFCKDEASMFEDFIQKHSKPYRNDLKEKNYRFEVFKENLIKIQELNEKELGSAVYGVTQFADLTYEEFSKKYLGLRVDPHRPNSVETTFKTKYTDAPINFDWREKPGIVSEVKDQGVCGSCWAFSVTGNIEGVWAVKKNESVSLSEQELVDCDTRDDGCGGGFMRKAYQSIIDLGGIESEADYPYLEKEDQCHFNKSLAHVKIDSYQPLPQDEEAIKQYLFENGPVSIGINSNAMRFYMKGIVHPWKWLCDPSNLDHGVLLVGYGVEKSKKSQTPFWIIKNSWGTQWGDKGYVRIYRGDNTCGVAEYASSAIVN